MSERFADEAQEVIPPANTWSELSVNQLVELKVKLESKMFTFAKSPQISRSLREGINKLQALIDASVSSR